MFSVEMVRGKWDALGFLPEKWGKTGVFLGPNAASHSF